MAPLIPDDLAEHFEGGVSILVGTRDERLRSEATRAFGAFVHPDRQRLTVFLPADTSALAIANLRANGKIAVGFSSILDHETLQVKGTLEGIRDATDAEHDLIMRYHVAFAEILAVTGIPRAVTRRLNVWPAHAVTLLATDLFQQTPGPKAGERVRS